jgi:hypothetical protein
MRIRPILIGLTVSIGALVVGSSAMASPIIAAYDARGVEVSGTRILYWPHTSVGPQRLGAFDVSDGTRVDPIPISGSLADIEDSKIAYWDGQSGIHIYDLNSNLDTVVLTVGATTVSGIHLAGDQIFFGVQDDGREIMSLDIASGTVTPITANGGDNIEVIASQGRLAYRSSASPIGAGGYQLILLDPSEMTSTTVAPDIGGMDFWGDWITWEYWGNGASEIILKNISSGDVINLGQGDDPDVGAGYVVWGLEDKLCARSLVTSAWACESSGDGPVRNPRVDSEDVAAYFTSQESLHPTVRYTHLSSFVVPEASTSAMVFVGVALIAGFQSRRPSAA